MGKLLYLRPKEMPKKEMPWDPLVLEIARLNKIKEALARIDTLFAELKDSAKEKP